MANYSVFVPAKKGSDMPDLTVKVEASNWLVALRESLKQVGEQGGQLGNIVCETAPDGSLRVADPASKRVFLITQITDSPLAPAMIKEAEERAARSRAAAQAAAVEQEKTAQKLQEVETKLTAPQLKLDKETQEKADELRRLEEERKRLEAELKKAQNRLQEAATNAAREATGVLGRVEVEKKEKKERKPAVQDQWDDLDDWYEGVDIEEETIDGIVADIFMATASLHEKDEKEAAGIVLNMATRYVSAEAASIFYSDMNSALRDLVIVAAKGPVAKQIAGARVPLGKGIVGFSVVNGVKLIVNKVNKNPNFYGQLDQTFGFQTRSILCVPISHQERTFGAIELINKTGATSEWTSNDSNVLESLAQILGRCIDNNLAAKRYRDSSSKGGAGKK